MSLTREQLIERHGRLGASETAAALGLSPWCTPLQLWQRKTSIEPFDGAEPNAYIEWGVRLERVILEKYCEAHGVVPLEAPGAWRVSEAHPWLGCTPDAVLSDRVVEVKTAASARDWGEPGTDQVPACYLVQVTQQMLVCGLERADVAVLISGHDYREYTVGLDRELVKELVERTWAFWCHVQNGTPPDVVTIADAARRWPREVSGSVKTATDDDWNAFFALREVKHEQDALEHEAEILGLQLRKAIGDAEALVDTQGRVLATWKAQNRTTLDVAALKQAAPDTYASFARTQSSRVFRLSTEGR